MGRRPCTNCNWGRDGHSELTVEATTKAASSPSVGGQVTISGSLGGSLRELQGGSRMSALDYVEIEREKGCGFANAGFRQYVKNNDTSRAIVATCRLEIREFGGTRERYEEHWVSPGAQ